MRITVGYLRQIIKEELKRSFLREGALNDEFLPKEGNKLEREEEQDAFVLSMMGKIKGKLANKMASLLGKEVAGYLKDTKPYKTPGGQVEFRLYVDDKAFIDQVAKYVQGGYKGHNEFVDALVQAAEEAGGKNPRGEVESGIKEQMRIMMPEFKKVLEEMGFTMGKHSESGGTLAMEAIVVNKRILKVWLQQIDTGYRIISSIMYSSNLG